MRKDAESNCTRCTGTDVVNIQGSVLCRHAKVSSRCRVMEHLRHTLPDASDCGATLPAIQGDTLSQRKQGLSGPAHVGRHAFLGAWGVPAAVGGLGSCAASLALRNSPCSITSQVLAVSQQTAGILVSCCHSFDMVMYGSYYHLFTK
jgi:hypothetical protein